MRMGKEKVKYPQVVLNFIKGIAFSTEVNLLMSAWMRRNIYACLCFISKNNHQEWNDDELK